MEYLQFSIDLQVVWDRENTINTKLLEYIIHKLILEFHSIIRQYVPGAYLTWVVVVNEDTNNSVCLFVGDGKSFQPSCYVVNNGEDILVS